MQNENQEVDVGQLAGMDTRQLVEFHRKLFGDVRVAPNPGHLRRKIAWHIQAAKEGGWNLQEHLLQALTLSYWMNLLRGLTQLQSEKSKKIYKNFLKIKGLES